jgi:hypothetical protein
MFEYIAQQSAGIATSIIAQQTPHTDEYDANVARDYPNLPETTRRQLAAYDRRVGTGQIEFLEGHGHMSGQTHPEVWIPSHAMSVFMDRGAIRRV